MFIVLQPSSLRVDREYTGTSSNGGIVVAWKAYEMLAWHSNNAMVAIW